ncbi:late competence protein ComER [Thalassobacillus hwangdonensis]|uniref:Pyrroline-5-carboxylate reductase n=1 Tax=Thalassobacillus hwangdonensis TaxID=546108 RepID=A0ABW3KY57_9BACI
MNWGIIGIGNMGTILIESLIESGALDQKAITITNRTIGKALAIQEKYKGIHVEEDAVEVARKATVLFICTKPKDMKHVFEQIEPALTKDHCVISITSPLAIDYLEEHLPCQVGRIVPSITNRAFVGVSLCSFSSNMKPEMKALLMQTFKFISKPIETDENVIRVSSDIVSCGPAFLSFLMEKMMEASTEVTDLDKARATALTTEMLKGYGELLSKNHYTLQTLREKVSVKGGVTGEGLKVLEANIGDLFHKLFEATQQKHLKDKEEQKYW